MSVARPETASEAKVNVSPEFCAQGTVSGENSDMNVQATGVALDSESQVTGCRTRLGESSYGARIAEQRKPLATWCCQGLLSLRCESGICRMLYAEKLLPHPQDFTAFGFLNVNPRFSRPV